MPFVLNGEQNIAVFRTYFRRFDQKSPVIGMECFILCHGATSVVDLFFLSDDDLLSGSPDRFGKVEEEVFALTDIEHSLSRVSRVFSVGIRSPLVLRIIPK